MPEHLPNNLNEDAALPVKGSLLMRMIRHIRRNRVTAGFGLLGERSAGGTTLAIDPSIIPDTQPDRVWKGIVTSSSSTSEEHTIREVDFDGNQLSLGGGGFETTNAKAYNGRKGVPVDTIVLVHEFRGETANTIDYRFSIPDGLTASPKDLVNTTTTADTDDWDVETQGSTEEGADFDPSRHALSIPAMFMYDRELTVDSSGFVTKIGAERETFISGDNSSTPKDGHITLVTATSGGATGKDVKLNQAKVGVDKSVTLAGTSGQIAVNSPQGTPQWSYDDSGRFNAATQTITLSLENGPGEPGGGLPSGCSTDDILKFNGTNWVCLTPTTQTVLTGVSWNATTGQLEFTRETLTIIGKAGGVADTDIQFYDCDGNTP